VVTSADSFGNRIDYSYDAAGQLVSMTLPGGKAVTYQYDHAHRLSKVADWAGNIALYRYDAAGYPQSVTVSGGPVTIYQYDAARNLIAVVSTGPDGAPVAGYRYTFDANGNRTGVTALEPYANGYTPSAYTLSVDAANRPVSRSDGQSYEYDARGNLSAVRGPHAAAAQYDAFGRLQSFAAGNTAFYSYDAGGLRVTRSDRRLVWDIAGARPRLVMETDSANTPLAWYVYGLGLLWKVTADGTPYFYHFDGDGNTVALSNAALGVVSQYRYDALGRLAAFNERVENPLRARGEAGWLDEGNGLVFTGAEFQFPELRLGLPASADPSPVRTRSTTLSVLGADAMPPFGRPACRWLNTRRCGRWPTGAGGRCWTP
jgi:YD repeat-containing protein